MLSLPEFALTSNDTVVGLETSFGSPLIAPALDKLNPAPAKLLVLSVNVTAVPSGSVAASVKCVPVELSAIVPKLPEAVVHAGVPPVSKALSIVPNKFDWFVTLIS